MTAQNRYKWRKVPPLELKQLVKTIAEQTNIKNMQVHCSTCDNLLMDRRGRILTKLPIWAYGLSGNWLGHAHEACAYGTEVPGIEANTADPNYGKSPEEWL